ncbi:hypothetical protein [Croceibacterium salegens]|nr:hypothetical protein [Croceibacterium salegens]
MIDLATLVLTHGLMLVALLRLMSRNDLDREDDAPLKRKPWLEPAEDGAE